MNPRVSDFSSSYKVRSILDFLMVHCMLKSKKCFKYFFKLLETSSKNRVALSNILAFIKLSIMFSQNLKTQGKKTRQLDVGMVNIISRAVPNRIHNFSLSSTQDGL